jgi:hypothetical protein
MRIGRSIAVTALALGACLPAQAATPYGFTVHITVSPRAAARLAAAKKPIEVVVYYEGEPGRGQDSHADDTTGQIDVGVERVQIAGTGNAIVTGSGVKVERLKWVKPGTLQMYTNIGPPLPTTLPIECLPLAFGNMKVVAGHSFNAVCKLRGE